MCWGADKIPQRLDCLVPRVNPTGLDGWEKIKVQCNVHFKRLYDSSLGKLDGIVTKPANHPICIFQAFDMWRDVARVSSPSVAARIRDNEGSVHYYIVKLIYAQSCQTISFVVLRA